ncbi:unnamed protein product [Trichogramma brassicae]|uniref:Integrase zinc-binding domain-containing protein n=1 Tax=Trichogramma brassicae TaxID=86971 RepID=A0A6H5IWG2_9HYME|nr:unnamed protein product [Trichogramma brassicae]
MSCRKLLAKVKADPTKYPRHKAIGSTLYHYRPDPFIDDVVDDQDAWKLIVPKDKRQQVLSECHEEPTAGHLGRHKTYQRLVMRYYWPLAHRDVTKYVRECQICQQCKVQQLAPAGLMGRRAITRPWSVVAGHTMGPFPRSAQGNDCERRALEPAGADVGREARRAEADGAWAAPDAANVSVHNGEGDYGENNCRSLCIARKRDAKLPSPAEFATGTLEDKLKRLDGLIRGLGQFIQGKSNLHKEVISYQVSLGMALSALRRSLESQVPPRPPAADKAVCTSPLFTGSATSKRLATSPLASHATPKRHAVTPASKQHDENNNEVRDQDGFGLVDRRRHRQHHPGPPMMRILQLNLNHCEAAQDLLCDTISELRIDVAILCEQYKNFAPPNTWLADADGQAAIWVAWRNSGAGAPSASTSLLRVGPNRRNFLFQRLRSTKTL